MIRSCNLVPTSEPPGSDPIEKLMKAAGPAPLNEKLLQAQPNYCECAYTSKRPLSWLFWIPGLSDGIDYLNRKNLNLAHEHIVFEQSGDNIGYGPHGLFSEDLSAFEYRQDSTCYDGAIMRAAVNEAEPERGYNFFWNNCQDFIEKVLSFYRRGASK